MLVKDEALKRERGYKDRKSFVRNDGTEVLHGKDWTRRKKELWERAKGQCEAKLELTLNCNEQRVMESSKRCVNPGDDPHHIVPRWPKRDDRLDNLLLLCRYHHSLLDRRKPQWRASR